MKHCILTTQILKDKNACEDYVEDFDKTFNGKVAITTQNLHKATLEGFPIDWLTRLLPPKYEKEANTHFVELLNRHTHIEQDYYDFGAYLNKMFEQAYPDGEGFPPVQEE
jgi:hypothetical protein